MSADIEKSITVLNALGRGPIVCIGGMVYDGEMEFLRVSNIDLAEIIPFLNELSAKENFKLRVERTDSGGSPTWMLC